MTNFNIKVPRTTIATPDYTELMKVTPTGQIEFPNAAHVDVETMKVYDETCKTIVGAHLTFKIKFKTPITKED